MLAPMADATSLTIRRRFAAPRDVVFRAWTDPAALKMWFACGPKTLREAATDPKVGGCYRFVMQGDDDKPLVGHGMYWEVRRPEKLVFSWNWDDNPIEPGESLVTVEFLEDGNATEIVLTHERLASSVSCDAHMAGWTECLDHIEHELGGIRDLLGA